MDKQTIIIPKNRSLKNYVDLALKEFDEAETIEARGEDIPFLVNQYQNQNKKIIGLTGSDLFKEYKLKSRDQSLQILKKIIWDDPSALFGKPTLCFLGPENKNLDELPKNLKVFINSKYKYISKKYLNYLEEQGFTFQKFYVNGETESTFLNGLSDLVIDVVYTGSSMKKNKLKIYDKIYQSDFVIIGTKAVEPRISVQKMNPYDPPTASRFGKLRLDFNENTIGCSPKVIEALQSVTPELLSVYPEYNESIEIFSKFFNVRKNQILMTNGTDEAIRAVFETYIEKNDEIILPVPTFVMFKVNSGLMGANSIEIPYNDDLSFPTEQVLNKINKKTRLIILVNPNNPTATSISDEDILKIIEKAKKFNALVFIDEAYYEFYKNTSLPLINSYNNIIISRTFSKAFGLAGIRFGFLFSNPEIISTFQKSILPYSVNQLALLCGKAALEDEDFINNYVREVDESKKIIFEEFKRLTIKAYKSDANFFLANFGDNCDYVYEELKKRNILVRIRSKYPLLNNCLRIGIGNVEQTQYFLRNLKEILENRTALLFDMDGVLVDVSQSYREAIKKTVEFFTNKKITNEDIQKLKNKGGFNDDWDISEELIRLNGKTVDKKSIIDKFQEFYLGDNFNGLILNERWLLEKKIIEQLSKKYALGIVTGRPRIEAEFALKNNNMQDFFKVIIAMEDTPNGKSKPDPYGIKKAMEALNVKNAVYIGDTIDDLNAAKNANIKFIGNIPSYVNKEELSNLFRKNNANVILENINKIIEVIQ